MICLGGGGAMGRRAAEHVATLPGVESIVIADRDAVAAEGTATRLGPRARAAAADATDGLVVARAARAGRRRPQHRGPLLSLRRADPARRDRDRHPLPRHQRRLGADPRDARARRRRAKRRRDGARGDGGEPRGLEPARRQGGVRARRRHHPPHGMGHRGRGALRGGRELGRGAERRRRPLDAPMLGTDPHPARWRDGRGRAGGEDRDRLPRPRQERGVQRRAPRGRHPPPLLLRPARLRQT